MSEGYIPVDLEDCFKEIERLFPDARNQIGHWKEDQMDTIHHGTGRWIRNNWGLWSGSRLHDWFFKRGIWHADDMSGIILTSYWRRVHDEPVDLEGQIRHYKKYWKEKK